MTRSIQWCSSTRPVEGRRDILGLWAGDGGEGAKRLKPVSTAATEDAAPKLWESTWEELTAFLRCDTEIRRIVCTTNATESVNARIRRAVEARGCFPNETATLKSFDVTFDGRLSAARQ